MKRRLPSSLPTDIPVFLPRERYLSISRVGDKLSRRKSFIYERIKRDPSFPKPIRLDGRPLFRESEIDAWVLSKDTSQKTASKGRESRVSWVGCQPGINASPRQLERQ